MKKSKDSKKRSLSISTIILFVLLGISIFVNYLFISTPEKLVNIYNEKLSDKRQDDLKNNKKDIINQINLLSNLYEESNKFNTESKKIVEGFSMADNTLPFHNYTDIYSDSGNCAGFVILELVAFNKKYSENPVIVNNTKVNIPDKKLGEYYLSEEVSNEIKRNNVSNTSGEIIYDTLLPADDKQIIFNYKSLKSKDTPNDIKDILCSIEYYQNNQNKFKNASFDDMKYDLRKEVINKIDEEKLVGIALNQPKEGHALLAYGYQHIKIDTKVLEEAKVEDAYKVYVADSNVEYTKKEDINDKESENNKVTKNMYVLFVKIGGRWQYIYNPHRNIEVSTNNKEISKINYDSYLYSGNFNSYIPNSSFYTYKISE